MPDEPVFRQGKHWTCFCFPERIVLQYLASFSFNVVPYVGYSSAEALLELYAPGEGEVRMANLAGDQQMSISTNPPGLPPGDYLFCGTGWLREIQLLLLGEVLSPHDPYCVLLTYTPRPVPIPPP